MSEAFKNRLSTAAQSKLLFLTHLKELFPGETVETEYRFDVERRWRFDCAIPGRMLGFEIEGGVFMQGAHTRGKGFLEDCEKYNSAAADGWKVFRFSTQQVMKGEARNWIAESL